MQIPNEKLIDMYRTMVRIRTFEERVSKEFASGNIPGFVHVYIGEEAIATGACANLRRDDYITSTHRGHGHLIAKGGKPDLMMAELFGRKTGYCHGKGGSMHIADTELGILGANGIVGGGITIAGGAALSAQMRGTDQSVICFLGDGASNRGTFHEGVNMAACWNLPVVYVIENNLYAEKTRITDTARVTNLADRATAYGIPDITVDGNDVIAVYEAVHEALMRSKKGQGPTLIECKTYRWHGHYEGDRQTYKPQEEIDDWKRRDPIPAFRRKLLENRILASVDFENIDRTVTEEIENAVKFAKESPFPAPEETLQDIFA
jgi:TPP-dependent pyruvate/acetoin dehydrogenase alpha subunit